MYPISYKREDNKIIFWYDEKEWKEWNELGKRDGNVGFMMVAIEDNKFITYLCYGTYEHPNTERYQLQLVHNEAFDGKLEEPEYYLKPLAEERAKKYWEDMHSNMRLTFLDFKQED